ncbi:UNVERIFIED_CONTAM: protein arginine N-methyltransferase 1.6 [Sesamum radiatum]|uniref:Protein arginine N-methyltransferase 1.6 n=1 Tax=Sesamum radiatum TaxID=300843 RepID=A0AAW2L4Y2_SESRA
MLSVLLKPLLFTFPRRSATATAAVRGMSSSLDSGGLTQRMFQLKVDPLTGRSEWVVIEEEEDDIGNQTTPKALLAATSYLDMLNDARRNRAFRQAIDKTVTGPCHVLDIGAGTGLLSMMAARAMGLSESTGSSGLNGMVTACESYLPMVKLMKKVLRANGMDGKIRIINKRSDELDIGVDIPSRADVLVSEILDSELLGEGIIPTLQHAHDKLLIENPQTVPYRATIYGQLVECTYLWEMHDLVNREAGVSDGIRLVPNGMFDLLGVKRQQYAMHCNSMKEGIKLLSEPFKVFDFDFWRRPDSSRETELHIKATNDGTVHAIISWWLLQLDSGGTIFYSTGPDWIHCPSDLKELNSSFPSSGNWCDHWKQSVWFTSSSGLHVFKDEEVQLYAVHTETSISYQFETSQNKKSVTRRDFCIRDCQIVLPPERIALYGDNYWRCLMLNAIGKALLFDLNFSSIFFSFFSCVREYISCVLVADDSIFLAIAVAHLSKSSHVIPLFPGLGKKGSEYLQRVAAANNYTMDRIEVLKKDLQSTLQDSNQRKISLFVAEPFYYGNDSVLPWQNLRFWKDRTLLDSVLSKDALIMPCRGLLRACAMYLPILSETTTILEFDFSKPMSSCSGKTQVPFRESGMCHGFVLWIDWVLDAEDNTVLSTGPDKRHWKQAVKLLSEPLEVGDADIFSTEIEAFFDPSNGELTLKHAFLKKQR